MRDDFIKSDFLKNIENAKDKIDSAKIVSFDIFDTLLVRPYINPSDIFKHIGMIKNEPSFHEARIQAELEARKMYAR